MIHVLKKCWPHLQHHCVPTAESDGQMIEANNCIREYTTMTAHDSSRRFVTAPIMKHPSRRMALLHVIFEFVLSSECLWTHPTHEVVDIGVIGQVFLQRLAADEALLTELTVVGVLPLVHIHVVFEAGSGRKSLSALRTGKQVGQVVRSAWQVRGRDGVWCLQCRSGENPVRLGW